MADDNHTDAAPFIFGPHQVSKLNRAGAMLSDLDFWLEAIRQVYPDMDKDRFGETLKLEEFLQKVAAGDPEAMALYESTGISLTDLGPGAHDTDKLLGYLSARSVQPGGAELYSNELAALGLSQNIVNLLTDGNVFELRRQLQNVAQEEKTPRGPYRVLYDARMQSLPTGVAFNDFFKLVLDLDPEALEAFQYLVGPEVTFDPKKDDWNSLLRLLYKSEWQGNTAGLAEVLQPFGINKQMADDLFKEYVSVQGEISRVRDIKRSYTWRSVKKFNNLSAVPEVIINSKNPWAWINLKENIEDFNDDINKNYKEELRNYAYGSETRLEGLFDRIYPDKELLKRDIDLVIHDIDRYDGVLSDVLSKNREVEKRNDEFLESIKEYLLEQEWYREPLLWLSDRIWNEEDAYEGEGVDTNKVDDARIRIFWDRLFSEASQDEAYLASTFVPPDLTLAEQTSSMALEKTVPDIQPYAAPEPGQISMAEVRALVDANNMAVNA